MLFILLFRFVPELLVEIEEEADVQHHTHRRGDGGRQTDLRQAGVGLDQQLSFFSVLYVPKRKCLSDVYKRQRLWFRRDCRQRGVCIPVLLRHCLLYTSETIKSSMWHLVKHTSGSMVLRKW